MEFAAEGSTADPFFLLRAGKKKAKSKAAADVPGGARGRCNWPAEALVIAGVREDDLRSSGLQVIYIHRMCATLIWCVLASRSVLTPFGCSNSGTLIRRNNNHLRSRTG